MTLPGPLQIIKKHEFNTQTISSCNFPRELATGLAHEGAMVIRRRDAEAGADADAETQMTD